MSASSVFAISSGLSAIYCHFMLVKYVAIISSGLGYDDGYELAVTPIFYVQTDTCMILRLYVSLSYHLLTLNP